jgi:hypothetical protein
MARLLLAALLLLLGPVAASAADSIEISRVQQDIRDLRRDVEALARRMDELRAQLARPGDPPVRAIAPSAAGGTGMWVDAAKWRQVKVGMSELEVIAALGAPTSMRAQDGSRVLLYAMEIGTTGFLAGSVTVRERVVTEVQVPALR